MNGVFHLNDKEEQVLYEYEETGVPKHSNTFMTSTWRGRGSGSGRLWTGGAALCRRPHKKYLNKVPLMSSCLLVMQEVDVFWTRILSLDGIKVEFFLQHNVSNIN